MSLLDIFTGGKSGEATEAQKQALAQMQAVQAPTQAALSLPELQKYAVSQNMTPAQMQAFLQQNNAFNTQNIGQQGTAAQIAAINQLAGVANAGAEGSATQRAQIAQVNQDAARNLAGQRGAIDQQAQARGVAPGMLQAALGSQRAGEGLQDAHMAALQAQGQNYQQALAAMASGANAGNALQGQQNTQANTVAQAQNAMQQFNAANQQAASGTNAGYQQQANMQNTQNANQTGAANTGLVNQRTQYNAQVPQQVFNNQMQRAGGIANQFGNIANQATEQGKQNAGIYSGLIGSGLTLAGGMMGGPPGAMAANQAAGSAMGQKNRDPNQFPMMAHGGMVSSRDQQDPTKTIEELITLQRGQSVDPANAVVSQAGVSGLSPEQLARMQAQATGFGAGLSQQDMVDMQTRGTRGYAQGGMVGNDRPCYPGGGVIPGEAAVPGDSLLNDNVPINASPGEAIIPRSTVQQNPADVMRLLQGGQSSAPNPQDIAALLAAMRSLRMGGANA